ncbi:YeeE/YedE family protein [Sulfitobacter sp. JBTF-M27]|uniref:YeeE/YedE family protein n=1 Tax=Sulfitobacter sediminilitoris TaxID=2698830 RepID=A0A6P0C7U4_9RHOB|nr:YeeE/YedE family protein [Sulfitobacter sediminilitoris]NEK21198.1 YeeE/YedE family protein [Sulfitobacter sediminilitoris]
MESLIDRFGEPALLVTAGAIVGLMFGIAAYHSRFCLRAATAEVAGGVIGPRLSIWLVAFLTALTSVQIFILFGILDVSSARQLATTGSMSGAIIGGLLFGCGMILARGCVSRLLVLSASGNLRAIITGLVVTLTAQAALSGVLAPAREKIASLWTVAGGAGRYLVQFSDATLPVAAAFCLSGLMLAFVFGIKKNVPASELAAAAGVGLAVAIGWLMTYVIASASFEVVAVQSVTFTGPSTDTLMALVNERDVPLSFGLGLVPGVFVGALLTALAKGEAKIQRFGPDVPMERYLIGGMLMGFGSMLAGGCAVGAGVSGGAILALTAWVAVFCMWVGAVATQLVLTSRPSGQTAAT